MILVLGQAAQGKTTLITSYLKESPIPSAWINLEKEDSAPFQFLSSIVESLEYSLQHIDFSQIHFIYPGRKMETESPLYREWAQGLFKLISIPFQIVLDGLDRLSSNAPAWKLLQIFLENTPPNVHWILISREFPPPPLGIESFRIRQEAWVLTNEELAFNLDEAGGFFKKICQIEIEKDQLGRIYSATEGWVGGLILLSESLSRLSDSFRREYISEGLPDQFKKEIFRYLSIPF